MDRLGRTLGRGQTAAAIPTTTPAGSPAASPFGDRRVLCGILFVLHTAFPWEYLPQELGFGSGMTCWRRLRGAGRHLVAQADQLTLDAPVPPGRVLRRQAQHQPTDPVVDRRPARPGMRVGPSSGDQLPMPPKQCRRGDEERRRRAGTTSVEPGEAAGTSAMCSWPSSCRPGRCRANCSSADVTQFSSPTGPSGMISSLQVSMRFGNKLSYISMKNTELTRLLI